LAGAIPAILPRHDHVPQGYLQNSMSMTVRQHREVDPQMGQE
jgi:hypothetical protein